MAQLVSIFIDKPQCLKTRINFARKFSYLKKGFTDYDPYMKR